MNKKQKRFFIFGGSFLAASAMVILVLTALSGSVTYFYTPSDIKAFNQVPDRALRLGGLVVDNSVQFGDGIAGNKEIVSFDITDGEALIHVSYSGILPDLFREGQGVVVQGILDAQGHLQADNVLAKHDETYMPKEVADALKAKGVWKEPAKQE